MNKNQDTRMPLTSLDVTAERMDALRELFPEAFTEGKVDFERLRQALGEFAEDSPERYGLSWAGKAEAKRAFQSLSSGTLAPLRDESVNFDTTENLIIEGDNLEVLKLLQKSYFGKVKMIYIDPPYNTGGDFIYPDDYREGLDGYLRYSGQVTDEGMRLETTKEKAGRFHSQWLNMMHPRLSLSRGLLREDGVIFVSIGAEEVYNLRTAMDEIFGEENFLGFISRITKRGGNAGDYFSPSIDYILAYARLKTECPDFRVVTGNPEAPDTEAPRTPPEWRNWYDASLSLERSRNARYRIEAPDGSGVWPPQQKRWRNVESTFRQKQAMGEIEIRLKPGASIDDEGAPSPWSVFYLQPPVHQHVPDNFIGDCTNSVGTAEVDGLGIPFEFPKPSKLVAYLLRLSTWDCSSDDQVCVLDFFAGSGTTAQAVADLNKRDNGRRRFILVQLPEPTPEGSEARNAGYASIADICRERVRRVIKKLNNADNGKLDLDEAEKQDRGFRALRLTSSNFKLWNPDEAPTDAAGLAEQLRLYADHLLPGRSQEDILYELLLKAGVPLGTKIAKVEVAGRTAFDVSDGLLLVCLEDEVTEETLRAMIERKPEQVLCLDNAFKGNDQLKTNTVLEMQSHDIKFHTV